MSDETENGDKKESGGKIPVVPTPAGIAAKVAGEVVSTISKDDEFRSAKREFAKSLETTMRAVNVVLSPVRGLVWGGEKIEEFVVKRVSEKMRDVPEERIQTPPVNIAGPVFLALRFAGDEKELQEMYVNLLAAAMDTATAGNVLPVFADRIRLMSSDEAIIMAFFAKISPESMPIVNLHHMLKDDGYHVIVKNFSHIGKTADCKHIANTQVYLDNLCHLGLLEIPATVRLGEDKLYLPLESDPELQWQKNLITQSRGKIHFWRGLIQMTNFGHKFCQTCIPQGNAKR